MVFGELKYKYCGETLVEIDGDIVRYVNLDIVKGILYCSKCKNIIQHSTINALVDVVPMSITNCETIDEYEESFFDADEGVLDERFSGVPVIQDKLIFEPTLLENSIVYRGCVIITGQIRDCHNVWINYCVLLVPVAALKGVYALVKLFEELINE